MKAMKMESDVIKGEFEMISTKKQIADYLYEKTVALQIDQMSDFCTMEISQKLFLSRTLVSQYLNDFYKDNEVIKINSRPVYYLSRLGLETLLGSKIEIHDFLNIAEFIDYFSHQMELVHDFTKAIGNDSSLEYCIEQMKAGVSYPPNGLHILLYGRRGSGKNYLCKLLYEYLVNQKILESNSKYMQFEMKDSEHDFIQAIKNRGYDKSYSGLIQIKNVEKWEGLCREQLQEFLLDLSQSQAKVRVIISLDKELLDGVEDWIKYTVPIKCHVPSYQERSKEEKEDFIFRFFTKEQDKIGKKLYVSSTVFQVLINSEIIDGIRDLKYLIRNLSITDIDWRTFKREEMYGKSIRDP